MTVAPAPRLRVRTSPLPAGFEATPLLDLVPPEVPAADVTCWLREGDGLIAWGRAAALDTSGPRRFADAEAWWRALAAAADVRDDVEQPGSGLVAFGSFSFAADSERGSALIVPEVLIGRRDGRAWITRVGPDADAAPPSPTRHARAGGRAVTPPASRDGEVAAEDWPEVIRAAVERIAAGEVGKVVLARDVYARAGAPLDVVGLLGRLSTRYAATWTFAVDGLIGATPEMLVRLQGGRVASRVLAGTVPRDRSPAPTVTEAHPDLATEHPGDPRIRLVSSAKEVEEHAYAARSVADALRPHLTDLEVPDEPFVLDLPDVYHLASDLSGTVRDGVTALRLVEALHPSAAVCGTPSDVAMDLIPRLERLDRGRYAGPVGWVDAAGNGDWGIALRCGQLDPAAEQPREIRLFAGGGIVAASDPDAELAETEVKLTAMRHALGIDPT